MLLMIPVSRSTSFGPSWSTTLDSYVSSLSVFRKKSGDCTGTLCIDLKDKVAQAHCCPVPVPHVLQASSRDELQTSTTSSKGECRPLPPPAILTFVDEPVPPHTAYQSPTSPKWRRVT